MTNRPLLAEALRATLGASSRLAVQTTGLDAHSARVVPADAAAIVVDIEPAPAVALRFCQELREYRPAVPLLALLCCPEGPRDFHLRALRGLGIAGVLGLDQSLDQVVAAVEAVTRGDFALHAALSPNQAAALGLQPDRRLTRLAGHGEERPVTERDVELLKLVREGRSDAEIASRLHVSASTVKADISAWCRRAGIIGRVQLAVWAERHRF